MKYRFGRYVPRSSAVHRLDPLVKMTVFLLVIASIFLATEWVQVAFVASYIFILCVASRVGAAFYLNNLKYFSWMFALSLATNVIFPRDAAHGAFSLEALDVAGIFSVRLGLMILVGSVLSATTAPSEIGESLLVFSALRGRAGRKIADLATVLSIALRFIPVMFEEAERIRLAQILRGRPTGGLRNRVRAVTGLVIPLFESSLGKAAALGFALEARCYGYMIPRTEGLRFGAGEIVFAGSSLACVVFLVLVR